MEDRSSTSHRLPYGISDIDQDIVQRYIAKNADVMNDQGVQSCFRDHTQFVEWDPASQSRTGWFGEPAVRIHRSLTYVYRDPADNFIGRWPVIQRTLDGGSGKRETHRLGNENSEDALTANVLLALKEAKALDRIVRLFTGIEITSEPELYLWGSSVRGDFEPWATFAVAQMELEGGQRHRTEFDAALHVPGQCLILIEAKFGSANTGLESKRRKRFLNIYNKSRVMSSPAVVHAPVDETPEQLLRNIAYANAMATPQETPWVINLVRDEAELDIEDRVRRRLSNDCRVQFQRRTWEQVFDATDEDDPALHRLRQYMTNKTLNLRPAFKVSSDP